MKLDFVHTFVEIFVTGLWLTLPLWLPMILSILSIGAVIAKQEKWSLGDGLYFSMITATTVGYGDIRPTQKLCRLLAIFIALLGLLLTGIVVSVGLQAATISFNNHYDMEEIRCQFNTEKC